MTLPEHMPARPGLSEFAVRLSRCDEVARIEPAGCCARVCIDTPLGQVCHCVAEAPFC